LRCLLVATKDYENLSEEIAVNLLQFVISQLEVDVNEEGELVFFKNESLEYFDSNKSIL